jgi:LacI family transcriptional regulator
MWQCGVEIPRDLNLIGFNDLFATRHMTPPFTTVGYDAAQMGELGAQLVLREIEAVAADRKPTVLTIKLKLNIRGSTGPVRLREVTTLN